MSEEENSTTIIFGWFYVRLLVVLFALFIIVSSMAMLFDGDSMGIHILFIWAYVLSVIIGWSGK